MALEDKNCSNEEENDQREAPIHGDVLEAIVSYVPLIDLAPACHVSKEWKRAILSSLRDSDSIKPWLIVSTQSNRSSHVATTHAYDPRSHVWMEIKRPAMEYFSAVRSSHSTLLYMMSPSKFSFSFDRLNATWHEANGPPHVWRKDPIVAVVGFSVVVAGGACHFEDDVLSVEVYNLETGTWYTCQPMPTIFKHCAAATWLSVAVDDHKMFITEKRSGITYSFDPSTRNWRGPYDLRPDPCMFFSAIGFVNNRLVLVGLVVNAENVKSVKMWEVSGETLICREIGEMPVLLVEMLKGENRNLHSIGLSWAGDFVYIYNCSEPEEVVFCELAGSEGGGACRWGSVRNVSMNDATRLGRILFTCSEVEIIDLQRALGRGNWKFTVKSQGCCKVL